MVAIERRSPADILGSPIRAVIRWLGEQGGRPKEIEVGTTYIPRHPKNMRIVEFTPTLKEGRESDISFRGTEVLETSDIRDAMFHEKFLRKNFRAKPKDKPLKDK